MAKFLARERVADGKRRAGARHLGKKAETALSDGKTW